MHQKAKNSIRADRKIAELMKKNSEKELGMEVIYEEGLDDFHSDEEPEKNEDQKEDMRAYLTKMNKRIESLVDAL
jgi:hypothetical protein